MSLSKPDRRERKCPRCRIHGIVVPQKNHMRTCPFLRCDCWRCLQVRAQVRAPQPSRPQDQEQRPGAPGSAAPPAEAPPSATSPGPAAGGALDLRCRAAGGEGRVARLERSGEPPLTSTAAFNAAFFNEMLETPPQAFLFLPVLMPAHYPDTFGPYPTFFCAPLWVTPVAFFNSGLLGPCPHLPPQGEAGLLAFWRQFLFSPSPPPPPVNPYPSPPPVNPYPSPPPVNPYPSPPPVNPYPSPPSEALQPLLPEDPEFNIVEVD